MNRLSDREQRLVALALLMLALAALWLGVGSPLLQGAQDRVERREAARQTLDRGERMLAASGQARRSAVALRNRASVALVAARSPEAARSRVQAHLLAAAAANGVTLDSLRPLAAPPPLLRFELRAHGDSAKSLSLLRQIEVEAPVARVDETDLNQSGAPADEHAIAPLGMRLVLSYAFTAGS